jgi:hypothetical protein
VPKADSWTAAIVTTVIAGNWEFSPVVGVGYGSFSLHLSLNDRPTHKSKCGALAKAATRTKRKETRWAGDCNDPQKFE